jgi:predicted nucleotidyltransferase
MDLSHPAFDVFGENEGRILHRLAVLAEGATGRRIHELAGVKSLRTTQTILERLTTIGLVRVRSLGHANEYSLNRSHVLWAPIERVLASPTLIEIEISKVLRDAFDGRLVGAAVYGSFARGEAGPNSDVDILIMHDATVTALDLADDIDVASDRIRLLTGNEAQILPMSMRELRNLIAHRDPLIGSLLKDARDLIDGSEVSALLRAGASE